MNKTYLGQLEEVVLLATFQLKGEGYGVTIQELIEERTGRNISVGALYATLTRLEQKGFISSSQGEATAERGGRAKRYYKVEGLGQQALYETQRMREQLSVGTVSILDPLGGIA